MVLNTNLAPETVYRARFSDSVCRRICPEGTRLHFIPPLHATAGDSENKRLVSEVICGAEHESGTKKGVLSQFFIQICLYIFSEKSLLSVLFLIYMLLMAIHFI